MQPRTEFYIGKNLPNKWSGIYGYRPEDSDGYELKGMMCAVARIESPSEEFQAEKFAHFSIDALQESYFNDSNNNGNTLKRLEKACWDMKSKMDLFLSRESEVAEKGIDVEMAVAVFKDNYLFVVVIGESYVFIKRGSEIVNIAEALEDINKTGFIKSGSLEIEENDYFAIATSPAITDRMKFNENFSKLNIFELKKEDVVGASLMLIGDESLEWAKEEPAVEIPKEDISISEEIDMLIPDEESVEDKNVEEMENEKALFEEDLPTEDTPHDNFDENEEGDELFEFDDLENKPSLVQNLSAKFNIFRNKSGEKLKQLSQKTKAKYAQYQENKKNSINLEEEEYEESKSDLDDYSDDIEIPNKSNLDSEEDFDDEIDLPRKKNVDVSGAKKIPVVILGFGQKIIKAVQNHFKNNQTTYAHYINKVVSGFKSVGNIAINQFKSNILGQQLNDRRYRGRQANVKRNRWLFIIAVVVISLFLYNSISTARRNARENRIREENTLSLSNLRSEYSTLATEVTTVQFGESANKTETLAKLDTLANKINVEKSTNQFVTDLDLLNKQVLDQKDKLQLISRVDSGIIITDLAKTFAGVDTTDLELSEDFLFVTDTARNIVYRMATNVGAIPEVFISALSGPTYLVRRPSNGEIVLYDGSKSGVISKFSPILAESLSRYSDQTAESVAPESVKEVAIFEGNGAIYEIRNTNQMIYKREQIGEEFATGGAVYRSDNPPNWKTDAELAKAVDIEAPFEIYALITDMGVRRYTGGGQNEIDFNSFKAITIADFDLMKTATALEVTNFGGAEGAGYLAVGINQTEITPGKIMLFEIQNDGGKSMKLVRQYQSVTGANLFNDIKEIQIDAANGNMYVMDGGKVLKLAL